MYIITKNLEYVKKFPIACGSEISTYVEVDMKENNQFVDVVEDDRVMDKIFNIMKNASLLNNCEEKCSKCNKDVVFYLNTYNKIHWGTAACNEIMNFDKDNKRQSYFLYKYDGELRKLSSSETMAIVDAINEKLIDNIIDHNGVVWKE